MKIHILEMKSVEDSIVIPPDTTVLILKNVELFNRDEVTDATIKNIEAYCKKLATALPSAKIIDLDLQDEEKTISSKCVAHMLLFLEKAISQHTTISSIKVKVDQTDTSGLLDKVISLLLRLDKLPRIQKIECIGHKNKRFNESQEKLLCRLTKLVPPGESQSDGLSVSGKIASVESVGGASSFQQPPTPSSLPAYPVSSPRNAVPSPTPSPRREAPGSTTSSSLDNPLISGRNIQRGLSNREVTANSQNSSHEVPGTNVAPNTLIVPIPSPHLLPNRSLPTASTDPTRIRSNSAQRPHTPVNTSSTNESSLTKSSEQTVSEVNSLQGDNAMFSNQKSTMPNSKVLQNSSDSAAADSSLPVETQPPTLEAKREMRNKINADQAETQARINSFLQIQRPLAETRIEFNEVFTMPLDSRIAALYDSLSSSNTSTTSSATPPPNKTDTDWQLVDERPRRWYRAYEVISKEITQAELRLKVTNNIVKKLTEVIEEASELRISDSNTIDQVLSQISALNKKLEVAEQSRRAYYIQSERLKEKRYQLEREIRTEGYDIDVGNNSSKESIAIQKYNMAKNNSFKPFPVPNNLSPATLADPKWPPAIVKDIEDWLAANDYRMQQNFKKEKELLDSVDKNLAMSDELKELKVEKKQLENEIKPFNEEDAILEKILKAITATKYNDVKIIIPNVSIQEVDIKYITATNVNKEFREWLNELKILEQKKQTFESEKQNSNSNSIREADKKTREAATRKLDNARAALKKQEDQVIKIDKSIRDTISQFRKLDKKPRLITVNQRLNYLDNHALNNARYEFIKKWNSKQTYTQLGEKSYINPEHDPLVAFIQGEKIQKNSHRYHEFKLTSRGYMNQVGMRLSDFMSNPKYYASAIIKLPKLNKDGVPSQEVFQIVKSPQPSDMPSTMPTVKFVETHTLKVAWKGVTLGELSHSINLVADESKEIIIERSTKLTQDIKETRTLDQEEKQHHTSSFEQNLQNEFSSAQNTTKSDQQLSKIEKSNQSKDSSALDFSSEQQATSNQKSTHDVDVTLEVSAGIGIFDTSMEANYKYSNSNEMSSSQSNKNHQKKERENAMMAAQTQEGQAMNKQSHDTTRKNVSNVVNRVAAETSSNNKASVTSSSSTTSEQNTNNKEVIKLNNINTGVTVNYTFHQLQNLYSTCLFLEDVKIVIRFGRELVDETGIFDTQVFELEEFNKIILNIDNSNYSILTAALVARKVLRQYGIVDKDNQQILEPSLTKEINSASGVLKAYAKKDEIEKELNELAIKITLDGSTGDSDTPDKTPDKKLDTMISSLKETLQRLASYSFVFEAKQLSEPSQFAIDTGALYVDATLGFNSALEPYHIDLRNRELLRLEATISHQHAETNRMNSEARYFMKKYDNNHFGPEFPPGVSTLATDTRLFRPMQTPAAAQIETNQQQQAAAAARKPAQ